MDTARIESLGITPLQAQLGSVAAIRTRRDLVAYLGAAQPLGVNAPLRYYVDVDAQDPTRYVGTLTQGGLSLPDRDYYLKEDAEYARYRAAMRAYVSGVLTAAAYPDAARAAERVIALESRLARAQWSAVQNRDAVAIYNRKSPAALAQLASQLDWPLFMRSGGIPVADVVVQQPSYVTELGKLVAGTSARRLACYLAYRVLDHYAPLLPARFAQASFELKDHVLQGTERQRERALRSLDLIDQNIGEISGRFYVERHFSADSKLRVQRLIANLLAAFGDSLQHLDWMSDATREQALRKLATIDVKIGYPDEWRDYGALRTAPDDAVGNVQRAARFDFERRVARLSQPVDRREWNLSPTTVNAYNNQQMNDAVFPAAILQPPFFDAHAEDAVNYGALGGVAGHEISHSFDDQGRQFDYAGRLRDWWTKSDADKFEQRSQRLVQQYSGYTVLDGRHLDGKLTLGENIADLAGLAIAYQGYLRSLDGRPAPVLDGFTGQQRVFLGWAQIWRRKYRDDNLLGRLSTDPHSPAEFRVNGVAQNLASFHEAFGTRPTDRMYRAPADRVKIW